MRLVQIAQLGVGIDCDCGVVYYSAPVAFVKCLALCRNVVHLDLMLVCIRDRLPEFPRPS